LSACDAASAGTLPGHADSIAGWRLRIAIVDGHLRYGSASGLASRALRAFSGGAGPEGKRLESKRLEGKRRKTMNRMMVSRGHCAAAL
jgi:hypothetical protein